jgi:hypothetical protein
MGRLSYSLKIYRNYKIFLHVLFVNNFWTKQTSRDIFKDKLKRHVKFFYFLF